MIDRLVLEAIELARGGRRLFAGFDLELGAGEAVVLTGANGAGKTSLLRAVAGFLPPLAGAVRFFDEGRPVDGRAARTGGLHLIGHADGLKPMRLAREELAFAAAWLGGSAARASMAAERLNVAHLLGVQVRRLSAGQRRRLALARLAAAPRALWLLDEPLAPLDAEGRAGFGRLMTEHLAARGLILAASHDPLPITARRIEIGA